MAEIYLFSNMSAKSFLERYIDVLGEEETFIENEESYEYEGELFYDLNKSWSVMESNEDEQFSRDVILQLAKTDKLIYAYVNEDLLEGELVISENGNIVRELVDCYSLPRLNINIGNIEYEKNNKKNMETWIDIGMFIEYVFTVLKDI